MNFTQVPTKILKKTIFLLEANEIEASVMVYKVACELLEAEAENKKNKTVMLLRGRLQRALNNLHEIRVFIDWNQAVLDKDNPDYEQNIQLMLKDVAVNERPQKRHGWTLKEICQQFPHLDRFARDAIIENLLRTEKIQVEETANGFIFCSTKTESRDAFDKCFDAE